MVELTLFLIIVVCFLFAPELILSKSTLAKAGPPLIFWTQKVCLAVLLNRSKELFSFFLLAGRCLRDEEDFDWLAPCVLALTSVVGATAVYPVKLL